MSILGVATAGGQIALQFLAVKPKRGIDDGSGSLFIPDATIEEVHSDDLEITDHPVEQGTVISDHAFKRPAEVIITAAWSDSPNNSGIGNLLVGAAANASSALQAVIGAAKLVDGVLNAIDTNVGGSPSQEAYQRLLYAQQNRVLIQIFTGKRPYKNMLIRSLAATTDAKTENSLIIRIGCRQILMAQTQTVTVPDSSNMKNPEKNGATTNYGVKYPLPSATYNAGARP